MNSAAPIRDADGTVSGVVVVFHDVTQQRRAEEALRKAHDELEKRVEERTEQLRKTAELARAERQRLYDVLETLPAMICLLTPDYEVSFANRSFRAALSIDSTRLCR